MPKEEEQGQEQEHTPWDNSMKSLVRKNPQALVSFLLGDAVYEGEVDRELKTKTFEADLLYTVMWQGKRIVMHVEFQKQRDAEMGLRMWKYNALTTIHTNLPVCSIVLYLVEDSPLDESPYVVTLPNGRCTQWFDYDTIRLWEIPPETFEQEELTGLLPLLPLTKGGKKREMVARMIQELEKAGKRDLLVFGYAFSSLIFTGEQDKDWLKGGFHFMKDILADTWVFQEIMHEGLTKGIEQGIEQGEAKGRMLEKKQDILQFVELRFPSLLTLAKQATERGYSLEQLQKISKQLYCATTVEDVRKVLHAGE